MANQELVKQSHECKDYFQKELLYRLKLPSSVQTPSETPKAPATAVDKPAEESMESLRVSSPEGLSEEGPKSPVTPSPTKQSAPKKKGKVPSPLPVQSGPTSSSSPKTKGASPQEAPGPSRMPKSPTANQQNDYLLSKELARILRHGCYPEISMDNGELTLLAHCTLKKFYMSKNVPDCQKLGMFSYFFFVCSARVFGAINAPPAKDRTSKH